MTKENLIKECKGRIFSTVGLLKPSLSSQLIEGLKGIQRVPALCFPYQTSSLQDLNLAQHEVVPMEPPHDLKEHFSNLLKELPKHLTNEENVLFEEVVEAVISVKEKLIGGSDYLPSVLCCSGLAPWRQLSPYYQKTAVHSHRTL